MTFYVFDLYNFTCTLNVQFILLNLLFGNCFIIWILILKEFVQFKVWMWLQISDQCLRLNCLPPFLCTHQLSKCIDSRLIHSIDNSLAFLNFNKISEFPSELFSNIEIVIYISRINELFIKNISQNPCVIYIGVASNVNKIISTVINIKSSLMSSLNFFGFVNVCIVNKFRFTVAGFDYYLFSILLQEHIDNFGPSTVEVNVASSPKQIVAG